MDWMRPAQEAVALQRNYIAVCNTSDNTLGRGPDVRHKGGERRAQRLAKTLKPSAVIVASGSLPRGSSPDYSNRQCWSSSSAPATCRLRTLSIGNDVVRSVVGPRSSTSFIARF